MRSTIGWNERETAGLGGLIGEGIRRSSNFVGEFGLPLPMARFSNAVAISINRGLMFTPAYKLAEIGGKTKSAWFATEADRHQRHVEAVVGTIFGALAWYLVYTGVITVRLRWPKDPEERELWERLGTRPGTVEFLMDDKRYSVSMTVGPLAYLAPYLAGASAAYDLMAQKQKRQDKLEAEARKKGLTAPPMPGWSMGEIAGVVGNAVWGQLIGGSRTATGLVGTLTDYGTWNLTKFGASQVAPLIPGIPAMQDMSRLAGVKLDSKAAGFWDYVLTTPWSKARRINMLGDPMGNPSDVERIVSSLTGGTVPWGVDVESKKNEDAYSALFSTGYRPPSIAPGKAFAFADGYRPMTEEEVSQYAQARGENFKQELIGLGPDPDLKEVQAAYARANQRALQSVGVTGTSSQPSPSRTSRAQVSTPRTSADVGISAPSLGRAGGRRFGSSLRMGMGRGPSLRRARRGRGFRPRSSRRLPSTRIGRSLRLRRPSLRRR